MNLIKQDTQSIISIAYGYCHCGCGYKTNIHTYNHSERKTIAGTPRKYINGHKKKGSGMGLYVDAVPFKIDGVYCRLIPVGKEFYAIVDESDYRWLVRWRWISARSTKNIVYACRSRMVKGKIENMYMHFQIHPPPRGKQVDHISTVSLDNRRKNLRHATPAQQAANRNKSSNNTSGFKGVHKAGNQYYVSSIMVNGISIYLGRSKDPEVLAARYREMAVKHLGEFARF